MFDVGKIVYLFDRKNHKIVPCRVVEKINTISLSGESTHHMVQTPSKKTIKLEEYKGPQFSEISEAKSFLLEAAENLIDKTIEETLRIKSEVFPDAEQNFDDISLYESTEASVSLPAPPVKEQVSDGTLVVDLPDGKKAKVSLPNGF